MEIGLPSETGRAQILKIHTARMRDNKKIASDVDLQVLYIYKSKAYCFQTNC
jgi:vesicle-fusing ATPase